MVAARLAQHTPVRAVRRIAGATVHAALTFGCTIGVATLAWALAAPAFGYQMLVDHSDSMRPAIAAGDLLVTKLAAPGEVRPGEVVTFQDPQHRGRLLTHRVVSVRLTRTGYGFVTRGDANTGVERWSIRDEGRLGRLTGRVPRAGLGLVWLREGNKRIVLLLLASAALIALLARVVWRL
jgi:signal peptidase I